VASLEGLQKKSLNSNSNIPCTSKFPLAGMSEYVEILNILTIKHTALFG
jgi:hypothetical protein